ncbi:hypothetical protein [Malonomonas rubra]|uniref:hypothetical protein n=1 Tax=Malonomonas rubra TaxID=57040 RepID=UPI0026EBFC20|nr:hypothetical protein [Malonomonas rubra]
MTDLKKQELTGQLGESGCAAHTKNWQSLSQRGLWQVLLFFLISIGALQFREIYLLDLVPADFRELRNFVPPIYQITFVLAIYGFWVTLSTLAKMTNYAVPVVKWSQLGYRSSFYLFYAFSGGLDNHFMVVFYLVIFLYGVEQGHVWFYGSWLEHREKELWGEQ